METSIKDIKELKIHGRTTECREPLTLFWTASGFECNVSGSELWVEVEIDYDVLEPWFSYTVNGDWIGRQMLIKGRYWIPLFRGMSHDKIKNVRFYKDLQAMSDDANSFIHIHALRHDGKFYPVEEKKLKLEFIGDSITSGEGLFGAKEEEDWIPMFFSALKDYAYQTSSELDAEYRVFSQSGWGVSSGWDNNINNTLPKHYKQICSLMKSDKAKELGAYEAHDFSKWQPDCIMVNLGTNDASAFEQPEWIDEATGIHYKKRKNEDGSLNKDDVENFKNKVKQFIYLIRECNPKSHIVWCYGMLGIALQLPICQAVSEYMAETGDINVCYLQLPQMDENSVGSRCHPGYLNHKQAAEVLVRYLKQIGIS